MADPATWHEHLFPNVAADALTERTNAISRRQPGAEAAGEIESFYDVLRWGTLPEQEHVLSLISRSFRPEFAPVLRAGLAVADLGLRAQAAAGLSLLETRTSSHLVDLQADYRRQGTEAAALRIAQALSDAAHSGLYDEARAEEMRREIVAVLQPLARNGATAAGTMLGRTLIQLGEWGHAVDTLQRAADTGEQNEAAFSWLLEGLVPSRRLRPPRRTPRPRRRARPHHRAPRWPARARPALLERTGMSEHADVCLLLEGTYPFVSGGVSVWVHQLLLAQPHLSFHLVCLTPDDQPRPHRFKLPANVRSLTSIRATDPAPGREPGRPPHRSGDRAAPPARRPPAQR